MKIRLSSAFVLILFFTFSCNDNEFDDSMPGESGTISPDTMEVPDTTSTTMTIPADTIPNYLTLDSEYIFDQEQLHTYELLISESNLDILNSDPAAEEYVSGSLVFNGDTLSPVGIRYKGSIGAFVGCLSSPDWTNPSGSKVCTKLSMKIKINWEGRTEKFYGLKKLQLHSMNNDDSQMRDRLGYHLFRSMNVPAPRAVHAKLKINGKYNGLFAVIEQIDGRFSKTRWKDDDGNIYKEVWPLGMDGNIQKEEAYISSLQTNEEDEDVSLITEFATELSQAEDLLQVRSIIEEYMHLDEILAYCIVDRLIRHDDGPFHWYCEGGSCTNHNYFWYEEPEERKLNLIAWDLDNAFDNIISDSNPVTPIADDFGETRNNCRPFRYGLFFLEQWSASCDKLTGGWASYTTDLDEIKAEFKAGAFSDTEITNNLNKWTEQIRAATKEANDLHGDAVSISDWERAVNVLKEQVDYSRING